MKYKPGERIVYHPDDDGFALTPRYGVFVGAERVDGHVKYWVRMDGRDSDTYISNGEGMSRMFTLQDHDLHEIG